MGVDALSHLVSVGRAGRRCSKRRRSFTVRRARVEMAQTYSRDESVSEARREHYRRVARIAERRNSLEGLDVATQYTELARWHRRRGNLICGGHPAI